MKIYKKVKYSVYEGVTKCYLELTVKLQFGLHNIESDQIVIKKIGISKLRVGDEFDEKVGKRIAESKALIKAYKELRNIFGDIKNEFSNLLWIYNRLDNKILSKLVREKDHKNKLINN